MPKVIDIDALLNLPMCVTYDEKSGISAVSSFRDNVAAFEQDRRIRVQKMKEIGRVLQTENSASLSKEASEKINRILGF